MASTNYELNLSDDGKTLEGIVGIRIPGDDGPVDVIIPDGVTDIGDRAFDGCTRLTSECIVWPGFSHGSSPWTNISR